MNQTVKRLVDFLHLYKVNKDIQPNQMMYIFIHLPLNEICTIFLCGVSVNLRANNGSEAFFALRPMAI